MTERELLQTLGDNQREIDELKRRVANLPMRFTPGGAGFSLPPATSRYRLLVLTDENGTYDWDVWRFSTSEET